MLTVNELSAKLNVSPCHVYRLKGDIGYVKVGGAIRFEESAVERFIEQNRHGRPRQLAQRAVSFPPLRINP